MIDISRKFLEGTGVSFTNYEVYDDCEMLMVCGVDADGNETCCELALDELVHYRA